MNHQAGCGCQADEIPPGPGFLSDGSSPELQGCFELREHECGAFHTPRPNRQGLVCREVEKHIDLKQLMLMSSGFTEWEGYTHHPPAAASPPGASRCLEGSPHRRGKTGRTR